MRELFVVTHAEATHHVDGLVGGWFDSSLTDRGKQQADALAQRLKTIVGSRATRLIGSDKARTRETAAPIADALQLTYEATSDLREMSYGIAEGKSQEFLKRHYTHAPQDNRMDFRSIEASETKREFATRIYRAIEEITTREDEVQIVVTHGFALTFVIAAWVKMPIDHAGWIHVATSPATIAHLAEDDEWSNRSVRSLST